MRTVALSEIADQIRGVSYGKADVVDRPLEGFLPVLRANNITEEGLTLSDLVFVRSDKIRDRQIIRAGDIIIAASSGSISVVGKSAQAQADLEAGFGAFCKVVRPSGRVDHRYLGHFFRTPDYRRKMSALAEGANINNLKNEHIDKLEIPLPPLDEQRRIAAILDQADALRRKRREAIDVVAGLKTALFRDMFTLTASASSWPVESLQDVVQPGTIVTYGMVQAGEEFAGGTPYIRTGDIVGGEIATAQLRHADPQIAARFQRARVSSGDIVMSIRATVGTTAIVPAEIDGANLTQGTAKISPGPWTIGGYLLEFLRSSDAQSWISKQVKGATFREITLSRLRELPVVVPPIGLQHDFCKKAAVIDRQLNCKRKSLAQLDALFASLQHRAFRGEL